MNYIKDGIYTLAEMLVLTDRSSKQRVTSHLESKDYDFTVEGRGKNTIYTIKGQKEVFKPTYPTAMKAYMNYIKEHPETWLMESASIAADKLNLGAIKPKSKIQMIYICRKELIEQGFVQKEDFNLISRKSVCNKEIDNAKLYIARLYNFGENFYKIGITSRSIEERFSSIPYSYEILRVYKGCAEDVVKLEEELHNKGLISHYEPKIRFCGHTECYSDLKFLPKKL